MFGRDHGDEDLSQRIDRVMKALLVLDNQERIDDLRRHVADDVVYVGPDGVFDGTEGLSEAFARFRHEEWQPVGLRRTSLVDQHHGYFRFTRERVERDAVAMSGWCFGSVDGSRGAPPDRRVRGSRPRAARRTGVSRKSQTEEERRCRRSY